MGLALKAFNVVLVLILLVQAAILGYGILKYENTSSSQLEEFTKARKINSEILAKNKQYVQIKNKSISSIEILNQTIKSVNPNIYIKTIHITPEKVNLTGEALDLASVNSLVEQLNFKNYKKATIERNNVVKNINSFSIVANK